MSLLLLLLGIVTTVAGLALVGSGLTMHDAIFDTDVLTPGTVAAVGGLLLIGMGLAVRELRRIEQALAARPMPRPARPNEASAVTAETPDAPVRIPFPPKAKAGANRQPASAGAITAPTPSDGAAIERPRTKFPTVARLDGGPAGEGADVAVLRRAPLGAGEKGEVKDTTSTAHCANETTPARVVPQVDAKARASTAPEKAKSSLFTTFWSMGPRRAARVSSAQVAAPLPPPPIEPAPVSEALPETSATAEEAAITAPVSVLKSGVVEGMAYTLYSDGSIEAQLPQGTLRFNSLTALRDHLESGSQL